MDTKFDRKVAAFKLALDDKEAATPSQLQKLKTEAKASSSFNFKGNKVQYEFNSSLLNVIWTGLSITSHEETFQQLIQSSKEWNLSLLYATSWFLLRTRAPRVGQPFRNTSRMNSQMIQRTRKNPVQRREERSSRSGRRNVNMPLTALTLQLLTRNPMKVHLLVCPLAVRFLLFSLFSHAVL